MKVLQVNNVYGCHSTGKITRDLHLGLRDRGHESVVVFGRGPDTSESGVIRLCPDWYGKLNSLLTRFTGLRYGGCLFSTLRLQRIIRREKPDVVHLQCINGNFVNIYRLVGWLKKHSIKTVCSLHAEFMYTANCGYALECEQWRHGCGSCPDKHRASKSLFFDRTGRSWEKMRSAFDGFEEDCVICPVSPWTEDRARQSDILKNFTFQTVYNGVDTKEVFHCRGAEEKPDTVLHVTAQFTDAPDHIKGGRYLIALAKRMPKVTFLVAGQAAPIAPLPENVILLGPIRDQQKLAELYRSAKLTVLVSKKETFSMPCAESLCCGTPVVGFEAGAPEQIALKAYSGFVPQGDVYGLEHLIRTWLQKETDRGEIGQAAENTYSVDAMVKAFCGVYGSFL